MTSLLSLSSDLLDRLSNPRFGIAEHEAAGATLAAILRDGETRARLLDEVAELRDPAELTLDGWMWILPFATANGRRLDRALLRRLCRRWSSPGLVALALRAALDDERDLRSDDDVRSIEQIADPWLRGLVSAVAAGLPEDGTDDRRVSPTTRAHQAETLFDGLLVARRAVTLQAARAMLADPVLADLELRTTLERRISILEPDSQAAWRQVLGLG